MNKSVGFAVLLALLALPAAADVHKTTGTSHGKPYLEATDKRNVTGSVISIDTSTRVVKLRMEDGATHAVVAGPEVKNFSSLRVGDTVKANITEQLRIEVTTGAATKDTSEVSTTSAKPGEKPHGTRTERTRTTASIVAIDKATGNVTVKGQDGNTYTVTAKQKENLDKIKIGDLVIFTATRSVAASVERAGAK